MGQLRQLRDVRRDPPRLVFGEQLRSRFSPGKTRPPNEAASQGRCAIDYFSTSTTKRVVVFCALFEHESRRRGVLDWKN
jgi:hypothetical protein